MVSATIIIPAHLNSMRLPEKVLLSGTGKPIIQHTYESSQKSHRADRVLVATDSQQIADVVEGFGGEVVLTGKHRSGSDRVAEVAANLDSSIVVNVQADEPEINAGDIDNLIDVLGSRGQFDIATLACSCDDAYHSIMTDRVKVVFDRYMRALYFSRNTIPYRNSHANAPDSKVLCYIHIGIYAYKRVCLLALAKKPPSWLEQQENLEQLRALSYGYPIGVVLCNKMTRSIDTEGDYNEFVNRTMDEQRAQCG